MTTPTMTSERAKERVRAPDWAPLRALLEIAIVVVCVGIAIAPILPVFASDAPLYAIIFGVVTGSLPVLVGGFLRWPAGLTILAGTGIYTFIGALVVFPKELSLGFLPSPTALAGILTGVVTGWKDPLTLELPLGAGDGNLLLPFMVTFLSSALVTGLVVWRRNWLSTIGTVGVVFTVLAVAILWGPPAAGLSATLGFLLAIVLTLWASWRMGTWRPKRWPALLGIFLISAVGASILVPLVPANDTRFVLRSVVIPPFDPSSQLSPLSKYRSFVKDFADVDLLTMTGLPQNATVRLATMDEFDGVVWNVSNSGGENSSAAFRRISDSVSLTPQELTGQFYQIDAVVGELAGVWLPTVGNLQTMLFDTTTSSNVDFRFNDQTKAGVVVGGLKQGMRYRLTGTVANEPSDVALGQLEPGGADLGASQNVPPAVRDLGLQITKDATTPALVARELETYLSERGYFSHGEQAGGTPSLSGHGADRVTELLSGELMVGDAEQYASAMALMAREQGLPARVVMGFIPEDQRPEDSVTFTGADMTAWVEINFDQFGWVSYFPTPDSSRTPQDVDKPNEVDPQPQTNQRPPDPQPPVKEPAPDTEETNVKTEQEDPEVSSRWSLVLKVVAGTGGLLFILAVWPALIIFAKWRRRKNRKKGSEADQIIGGWKELLDSSYDLGLRPQDHLTRRQTAELIAPKDPLTLTLAELADYAVFSQEHLEPGVGVRFWDATEEAVRALGDLRTKRARLRARLSRASLRRNRAQSKQQKVSASSL